MKLGDIKVRIGVDTRDFTQGLGSAKAQAQAFAQAIGGQSQAVQAATRALAESSAITTGNTEKSRQLSAASKELAAARARLVEVMGGESKIQQEVAAKYAGLQNVQRAQLIEVREAIAGLEAEAAAQKAAAAAAVKAQEEKIAAAGRAALANRAAAEQAIKAAEAEAAADIKAALAAGQRAAAEEAAAVETAQSSAIRLRARVPLGGGLGLSTGAGVGPELLAVGAIGGLAAGFAASVKASIEFNQQMANVAAVSGNSAQRIAQLSGAVQNLAIETGKDTGDLAKGLYQVVSAFGNTADSAKILAINTRLAIGGLSTTEEAIKLTSAVTKAYGDTSAAAQQHVSDLSLETVKLGQTRLPELAASMGKVTPLAAQLALKQEELFGVMATGSGVTGNAARVSTQFRGILQSLLAPTEAMQALFAKVGVTSGQALIHQRGFQGAVQLIVDTAQAADTPLSKYIGRIEGQTLAYALAGPQARSLTEKIQAMFHALGETNRAVDAQQKGVNKLGTDWDKLRERIKVAQQNLGQKSAPWLDYLVEQTNVLIMRLQRVGPMLNRIGQGLAGVATGHQDWGEAPATTPGGLTPQNLAALALGPAGRMSPRERPYGPAIPAGLRAGAATGPTDEQQKAHQRVLDDMEAAGFARKLQEAIQYHGELSKQVEALRLYHQAWETLTGGQQKNTLVVLANEKAEQKSKDAVKAHQDALDNQAKAQQKAADERRRAAEAAAKEREKQQEDYRSFLKEQQLATREANRVQGTGISRLQEDHPGWSAGQYKKAFDAQTFREFAEAAKAASKAAEEADQAANVAMRDQVHQQQLDEMSTAAKKKYGEINRESLALESQWSAHYQNLAPNQQKIIDQLYALALVKQYNERQDKIAQTLADQRQKDVEASSQAYEKEKDALLDLAKAMEKRRREADKDKQAQFDQGMQALFEKQNRPVERYLENLTHAAEATKNIFEQAFHDAYERGPKAFFSSIVRGVEQTLQQAAARYLASKLTDVLFGKQTAGGDRSEGGGLAGVLIGAIGGLFGHRAAGGMVQAGHPYMVGEAGRELFVPSSNGSIVPNAQLAGAGVAPVNITMHVHGVTDANSFRQNKGAIQGDLYRAARKAFQRDG